MLKSGDYSINYIKCIAKMARNEPAIKHPEDMRKWMVSWFPSVDNNMKRCLFTILWMFYVNYYPIGKV